MELQCAGRAAVGAGCPVWLLGGREGGGRREEGEDGEGGKGRGEEERKREEWEVS